MTENNNTEYSVRYDSPLRVKAMVFFIENVDGDFISVKDLMEVLSEDRQLINEKTARKIWTEILLVCKKSMSKYRVQETTVRRYERKIPTRVYRFISKPR